MGNGDLASITDARLFLPETWCDDPARMEEAGIPEGERKFNMKWEMGIRTWHYLPSAVVGRFV